jgi:hypothetical protein
MVIASVISLTSPQSACSGDKGEGGLSSSLLWFIQLAM